MVVNYFIAIYRINLYYGIRDKKTVKTQKIMPPHPERHYIKEFIQHRGIFVLYFPKFMSPLLLSAFDRF